VNQLEEVKKKLAKVNVAIYWIGNPAAHFSAITKWHLLVAR
jgi:hypothetical protein